MAVLHVLLKTGQADCPVLQGCCANYANEINHARRVRRQMLLVPPKALRQIWGRSTILFGIACRLYVDVVDTNS